MTLFKSHPDYDAIIDSTINSNIKLPSITILPDGRLSRKDAAAYLGFSVKSLAERCRKGLPPHSKKVSGKRFYLLSELDDFIKNGGR